MKTNLEKDCGDNKYYFDNSIDISNDKIYSKLMIWTLTGYMLE